MRWSNLPRFGTKEVHGGGERGLKPPGGANATTGGGKGGAGHSCVGGASSQGVVSMEGSG